jgi:hypothetical protein
MPTRPPLVAPSRHRFGLLVAVALAACAQACAESTAAAPTVSPVAPAAEPEAPATAISVLLAERTTLALTSRQVDQLTALDHELQVVNGPLEAKLAAFERAHAAAGEAAPSPGSAMGGGPGMGGGGMSRGRGGGGMRGMGGGGRGMRGMGGGGAPRGSGSPAAARPARASGKSSAEEETTRAKMFEHHAAALRAAFDLLNPTQRKAATEILDDNGYDRPEEPGN